MLVGKDGGMAGRNALRGGRIPPAGLGENSLSNTPTEGWRDESALRGGEGDDLEAEGRASGAARAGRRGGRAREGGSDAKGAGGGGASGEALPPRLRPSGGGNRCFIFCFFASHF